MRIKIQILCKSRSFVTLARARVKKIGNIFPLHPASEQSFFNTLYASAKNAEKFSQKKSEKVLTLSQYSAKM